MNIWICTTQISMWKAKVVCADGSPLPDDTDVAPVNLTLHSLFSQVGCLSE